MNAIEQYKEPFSRIRQPEINKDRGLSITDNRPSANMQRNMVAAIRASEKSGKTLFPKSENMSNVIQGEFISIIGEEEPPGTTTLDDAARYLQGLFGEETYYTKEDIEDGMFRSVRSDETIYLIAHGDNPALETTTKAALGGKEGSEVKNIVKSILKKFVQKNKSQKFSGRIILEGCHTAEPLLDRKAKTGSLLYDFQEAMKNDSFFSRLLTPEVAIGGYLGSAFTEGDYSTGYGTVNTEHPLTIAYQKRIGADGERETDGSMTYDNEDSFLETRWRQTLPFGAPRHK